MAKKEDDIIRRKLKLYDFADEDFLNSLTSVQKEVLKSVLDLLGDFDQEGGKLKSKGGFLNLLNSLNKKLEKVLKESNLPSKVDDYLRNFDEMDKLNKELHLEANDLKLTKVNLNPVKTDAIRGLSAQLSSSVNLDINLVQPIKDIMFRAVTTGMTFKEARQLLEDFILGNKKKLGHIKKWAGQIARDALNQYDGLVNDIIAEEYGLNAYRYVGSLVTDSRPQCVRWVGMRVLPIGEDGKELQREINWAFNNGSGMIPGTTYKNFATFRGGYNCRHMAIPFRLDEEK